MSIIKSKEYYETLQKELVTKVAPLINFQSLLVYDRLRDALAFDIGKPEYGYVRKEIIMCLIHHFNQAAITFTNHYLEKHLKYRLINHSSGIFEITDLQKDNEKMKQAVEMYGGKSMGDNIKSLIKFGLIDSIMESRLTFFKNNFRNPYSHSDFRGIFKSDSATLMQFSYTEPDYSNPTTVDVANFLMLHGESQKSIAEKEALNYFLEVDKMVCDYELSIYPILRDVNRHNNYPN